MEQAKQQKELREMKIESDRLYRRRDVEQAFGFSRSTIYRLMDQGLFPKPIRIGPRSVAWEGQALQNYVQSCEVAQ